MVAQKIIYIVDDDDDDRFLIKGALAGVMENLNIIEFNNGIDFLKQIGPFATLHPVLVLLDINMPRMSGLEVITALRADFDNDSLPIFAISTASSPDLIQEIITKGASGYFTKPDNVKGIYQLAENIKQYFANRNIR
jgi:CheY-like chemotaxis protein